MAVFPHSSPGAVKTLYSLCYFYCATPPNFPLQVDMQPMHTIPKAHSEEYEWLSQFEMVC
jgi:hypothetical protein